MEKTTPMLQQYQRIKSKHQDCILFFRLGDFYEMFCEDAIIASKILDLVLTARGKGTTNQVPMCGIPHHAADAYIPKLIKNGLKVAICEQIEDPSTAKGIVERDVIRIITSGTYLDDKSSDARYILCISPIFSQIKSYSKQKNLILPQKGTKNLKSIGLSFIDPTTGTIQSNQYTSPSKAFEIISRLPIYECVYPINEKNFINQIFQHPLLKTKSIVRSPHEDWCFNTDIAHKSLTEHFSVSSLKGFGIEDLSAAVSSAGALLEYLKQMNKQPLRHIDKISLYADSDYVFISPAATYGLEIENLFKTINFSLTAMGKRNFRFWLYHPLKSVSAILQRQAAVSLLKGEEKIQKILKNHFGAITDIEKSISRLSCGYIHAKDILAIRNALDLVPLLQSELEILIKKNKLFDLKDIPSLRKLLNEAISPDIPLSKPEGKIIKAGYHQELDKLRDIQENGREWLRSFQRTEIKRTGITSLKVGFNKVFGYYIEVSKGKLNNVPDNFIRKQTLVNAERFITPELKEYEERILTAQDKILKIENEILHIIQNEILDLSVELHQLSQSIATIDSLYSLSVLAQSPNYHAPQISENTIIDIKEGRHPVVEKTLSDPFIANDTFLDCADNHLIILTGPNMAGKSTYIRQIAVLVILAQMGSYLPVDSAHMGVVDKIFTRIGAQDDISKGQSTFMVEMNETADILNNATDRSLIILDEIGRGTSTYDGLSLAWALAEHLQKMKSRTLFATHFHELTALANELTGIKNYNVSVKEWQEEIIFLHKIIPGSTDDSYGIYVAKLAGIPKNIIQRSKTILTQLELQSNLKDNLTQQQKTKSGISSENQLSLFTPQKDIIMEEIKDIIKTMDVNQLTPLAALNKIQEWKELIDNNN